MLYRSWFDEKTGLESLQLCVPQHFKGDLLQELHDLCGHLSVLKITDNVRKRSTGLATLRILSCTVELVTRVAPETDQFLDQEHPCNPLRQVIHWRGSRLIFLDHFPIPIEEANMLPLWWISTQSGLKRMPCRIKRLANGTVAQVVMDNFVCRFGYPLEVT